MYIRKVSFKGIGGSIYETTMSLYPSKRQYLNENVNFFNLERYKYEYGALKTIGLIGLNASGKTTILEGIATGLSLLVSSISVNSGLFLKYRINEFLDSSNSIFWKYELVCDIGNKIIRKYFIELEINNGKYTKEKLSFKETNGITEKQEKIVYELNNEVLIFNGKKMRHNNNYTVFSILKTLNFNPELNNIANKHSVLLSKLAVFVQEINPIMKLQYPIVIPPKETKPYKALLSFYKNFDNNIKEIGHDPLGRLYIKVKGPNGVNKEIQNENIMNYFSEGTNTALRLGQLIYHSAFGDAITMIDEIDQSIHSGLIKLVVEILKSSNNSQSFFTTHSTDIFSLALRDDQIILVEKNKFKITAKQISNEKLNTNNFTSSKYMKEMFLDNPDADKVWNTMELFENE